VIKQLKAEVRGQKESLAETDDLKAENKLLLDELTSQEKASMDNLVGKSDAGRQLKQQEETVADLEGKLKSVNLEVVYLKDRLELVEQEDGKSKAAHADARQQLESSHDNTVCVCALVLLTGVVVWVWMIDPCRCTWQASLHKANNELADIQRDLLVSRCGTVL